MCSQMEFQRKVLGEAKFPVYILQGANDLGQVREEGAVASQLESRGGCRKHACGV